MSRCVSEGSAAQSVIQSPLFILLSLPKYRCLALQFNFFCGVLFLFLFPSPEIQHMWFKMTTTDPRFGSRFLQFQRLTVYKKVAQISCRIYWYAQSHNSSLPLWGCFVYVCVVTVFKMKTLEVLLHFSVQSFSFLPFDQQTQKQMEWNFLAKQHFYNVRINKFFSAPYF